MYSAGLNFPNRWRILVKSKGIKRKSKWERNNEWLKGKKPTRLNISHGS